MSWKTEPLGNLLAPAGNARAGKQDLPVLSITMHGGLVDQSEKFKKRVASQDISAYRVVYTNELVVGFPIDEGVLGFQTKYSAAVVSPAYGIWKLKRPAETHIPFLEGYLRSGEARKIYAKKMRGAVARRRSINREDFLEIEIPFPPIEQQRKIVSVLDRANALHRQRHESLQLTERLRESVFLEMFGDPQMNPMDWPGTTVGEILSYGPQNGLYQPQSDYGSGTRILRIDGFYDGEVVDEEKLKRLRLSSGSDQLYLLKEDDIVINRVNSLDLLGKSAIIPRFSEPVVFESNIMRLGINKERMAPRFLIALLQTPYIRNQILSCAKKAVNQASINQTDVKRLQIYEPPKALQQEYVRRIVYLAGFRKNGEAQEATAIALCSSLQQRAFRGELDLSRLVLDSPDDAPMAARSRPATIAPKSNAAPFLIAPRETEPVLKELDAIASRGEPIPWSADYFKYRILGAQSANFSFGEIKQKAESVFDELHYEEIKDIILELLGQGGGRALLRQSFDLHIDASTKEVSGRKEIVFGPAQ